MMRTCTLACDVSIGWANVAQNAAFLCWIEQRMAQGYHYGIIEARYTILYNNATKINTGVRESELSAVLRTMRTDFLTAGDISVVRIDRLSRSLRVAENAQDVLTHDTVEFAPE